MIPHLLIYSIFFKPVIIFYLIKHKFSQNIIEYFEGAE